MSQQRHRETRRRRRVPAGLFVVLQAGVRGRNQLPCTHSCTNWAGSNCRKVGGHRCSRDTTAIDGGALDYGARTEAARIDPIDRRMAGAIGRSWREEWGAQLSPDELMQHGLCRHAEYQFSKELSSEEEEEPMEEPAMLTVPAAALPTDTLCTHPKCNWTRSTLEGKYLTWDNGSAFQHVGNEFPPPPPLDQYSYAVDESMHELIMEQRDDAEL